MIPLISKPSHTNTYTGHEDFDAMRPYFAIGDKQRQAFMEKHF